MSLKRVDVSAYSNNVIRKEDGRFYMAHEVDSKIDALKADTRGLAELFQKKVDDCAEMEIRMYRENEMLKAEKERLTEANRRLAFHNQNLQKDAERYQWVRENVYVGQLGLLATAKPYKTVDEFIDIAMSALPDTKGE